MHAIPIANYLSKLMMSYFVGMTLRAAVLVATFVFLPSLRARGESLHEGATEATRVWNIGVHQQHSNRVGILRVLSHNVSPIEYSSTYNGDLGAIVALQLRAYGSTSRVQLDGIERLINSLPDEHLALLRRFFEQGGRVEQAFMEPDKVSDRRRRIIRITAADDVDGIVVCANLVHELVEREREATWMHISPYTADHRKSPGAFREEVLGVARPVEIDARYEEIVATIAAAKAYYGEEEGTRLLTAPVINVGSKTLMVRHEDVVRALALGLMSPEQARDEIERVALAGDDANIKFGLDEVRKRANVIHQEAQSVEKLFVNVVKEDEINRVRALPPELKPAAVKQHLSVMLELFQQASQTRETMDAERWLAALEETQWLLGEVARYVFRSP